MNIQRIISYFYLGCTIYYAFKDINIAVIFLFAFLLMDVRADVQELQKLIKTNKEESNETNRG